MDWIVSTDISRAGESRQINRIAGQCNQGLVAALRDNLGEKNRQAVKQNNSGKNAL